MKIYIPLYIFYSNRYHCSKADNLCSNYHIFVDVFYVCMTSVVFPASRHVSAQISQSPFPDFSGTIFCDFLFYSYFILE